MHAASYKTGQLRSASKIGFAAQLSVCRQACWFPKTLDM
jgi:hypothetical protein